MSASAHIDPSVDYQTDPSRYRHWKLAIEGRIATLGLDVDEAAGMRPGYALKLNSYDLSVDIELHDALNRIRFEHPQVGCVVVTSLKDRVFCSGANIFMLGSSSHAWKINFCKFTNETRNGIEDASRRCGLKFLAALNGSCAGGGYELAMACDEILLVDDRSSAVSLPEIPLLGVLPGTGGLTRLIDKRRVRADRADLFCTIAEGVRGQRALDWRLVDGLSKPAQFDAAVAARAAQLAAASERPASADGIALPPLHKSVEADALRYRYVEVSLDHERRCAAFTIHGPGDAQPQDVAGIRAAGAKWWPLQMARELDDAILSLRTNEIGIGVWVFRTRGETAPVLAASAALAAHAGDWFVREVLGHLRRTFARLEVTSRSLFALIDSGSCWAGLLAELALAADRSYMLSLPDDEPRAPRLTLDALNLGGLETIADVTRLAHRLPDAGALARARERLGSPLAAQEAEALGLVTIALDDIDWDDEVRIALEERAAISPDALTGMEANLRFGSHETMATRIFGRLSAWQNWIFSRPNAVGDKGTLKVYGKGEKAHFDFCRT